MNKLSETLIKIYDKKYILLSVIPIIILLISGAYLGFLKYNTGEFVKKDVSLSGGVMITITTSEQYDLSKLKLETSSIVRTINSPGSNKILGYSFESNQLDIAELKNAISDATGFEFLEGTYSIEETSAALSSAFWKNAIKAMILAFIFIGTVVFLYFKKIVPSSAIVLSAVSDIILTLTVVNLFNIRLSTAGIAAILMLIGYSVDSNILLTTRVIKGKSGYFDGLFSAIKTGLTMQITTLVALICIFLFSPAEVLKKITLILVIGILADMMNTWMQNAGILRWWTKKNE